MNKQNFIQKISVFLENFDFKASKEYVRIVYEGLLSAGVSDTNFNAAFSSMMLRAKSDMFGRPALGDWLNACDIPSVVVLEEVKGTTELNSFLEKIIGFLTDRLYYCRPQDIPLNEFEERVLRICGGLQGLYYSLHKDKPTEVGIIRRSLETKFKELYDVESFKKKEKHNAIEYSEEHKAMMRGRLSNLLGSVSDERKVED